MNRMNQKGITLMELLVSLALFGIVGGVITSTLFSAFQRMSIEQRLAASTDSARLAVQLLTSELRMSSQVSPYLPGTNSSLTTCNSAFDTQSAALKFLVSHDSAASRGTSVTYIGYSYDPVTKQLFRGEVSSTSNTSCATPASDPNGAFTRAPLATNIIPFDTNSDGSVDDIFSFANSVVTVSFAVEIRSPHGEIIRQPIRTEIDLRNS
jgi:prepilin-type N-terminal cleavage/methylation domain-containing protein